MKDIRYALRQFANAPIFTATAVLTLALGIGATTAIFTLVHAVLLNSLPVAKPAELYRVGNIENCCVNGGLQDNWSLFSYDKYKTFRDEYAGLPRTCCVPGWHVADRRAQRRQQPASSIATDGVCLGKLFCDVRHRPICGTSDRSFGRPQRRRASRRDELPRLETEVWQRSFGGRWQLYDERAAIHGRWHRAIGIFRRQAASATRFLDPAFRRTIYRRSGRSHRFSAAGLAGRDRPHRSRSRSQADRSAHAGGVAAVAADAHRETSTRRARPDPQADASSISRRRRRSIAPRRISVGTSSPDVDFCSRSGDRLRQRRESHAGPRDKPQAADFDPCCTRCAACAPDSAGTHGERRSRGARWNCGYRARLWRNTTYPAARVSGNVRRRDSRFAIVARSRFHVRRISIHRNSFWRRARVDDGAGRAG